MAYKVRVVCAFDVLVMCQVNYLSVVGGATVKDFISRTMGRLLDPELAKRFVWAGRLTKKHAFKQLELASVLSGRWKLAYSSPKKMGRFALVFCC